MFVFIPLDQCADDIHERGQWMTFVTADFIQ